MLSKLVIKNTVWAIAATFITQAIDRKEGVTGYDIFGLLLFFFSVLLSFDLIKWYLVSVYKSKKSK